MNETMTHRKPMYTARLRIATHCHRISGLETDACQKRPQHTHQRNVPLGAMVSVGQVDELPVHISAVSHLSSLLARQVCVLGAKLHWSVQQGLESGSQAAFSRNLQVAGSQQVEFALDPGSQSSPSSTMPFPHIWSEIMGLVADVSAGLIRQLSLSPLLPRVEPD